MRVITSAVGIALLGILLGACQQPLRSEYSDTRAAKARYRECLRNNPGDPDACESQRAAAGEQYEDYRRRQGCDISPNRCTR